MALLCRAERLIKKGGILMAKAISYAPDNCKGIIDGLKSLGTKHSIWKVFEDWLQVCSISISNTVDWTHQAEREEQYLETDRRTSKGSNNKRPL